MFKVWNKDGRTNLILCESECGGVVLMACGTDGEEFSDGDILQITSDGKLKRRLCCDVPGIQTDDDGKILLAD